MQTGRWGQWPTLYHMGQCPSPCTLNPFCHIWHSSILLRKKLFLGFFALGGKVYDHRPHNWTHLLDVITESCRAITASDFQGWTRHAQRYFQCQGKYFMWYEMWPDFKILFHWICFVLFAFHLLDNLCVLMYQWCLCWIIINVWNKNCAIKPCFFLYLSETLVYCFACEYPVNAWMHYCWKAMCYWYVSCFDWGSEFWSDDKEFCKTCYCFVCFLMVKRMKLLFPPM